MSSINESRDMRSELSRGKRPMRELTWYNLEFTMPLLKQIE
jgi:hypothetical protein